MAESKTYYLWSTLYNGGETEAMVTAAGVNRRVVLSRNVLQPGEKVTREKLGASEAQWDEWVDTGVVRPYAFPKDLDPSSNESPMDFLRRQIREGAISEEERLLAAVEGSTSDEETLVKAQK